MTLKSQSGPMLYKTIDLSGKYIKMKRLQILAYNILWEVFVENFSFCKGLIFSDFARRGNSPAASESGSDDWGGNKGGNERQWDNQNWESTEFKKSGWDEPDSIERFSQQKDKKREPRKHSEGEQWDAPRQSKTTLLTDRDRDASPTRGG